MAERLVYEAELDAGGVEKGVKTMVASVERGAKGVDKAMEDAAKGVGQVTTELEDADKAAKDLGKGSGVGELASEMQDAADGAEELANAADDATEALEATGVAGEEMGEQGAGGFRLIDAAIAASGLGLLLKILQPIIDAFLENKKVAELLQVAMAGVGAVIDGIIDAAEPLVDFLVNAFKNPQDAIDTLKEKAMALGDYFTTLIEVHLAPLQAMFLALKAGALAAAVGVKEFFGGDASDLRAELEGTKQDLVDLKDATIENLGTLAQPFKDAAEAVGDFAERTANAVSEATALEDAMQRLTDRQRNLNVAEAEARAEIEELKKARDDERLTFEERIAAAEKAGALDMKFAKEQQAIAEDRAAALREEIRLQGETTERLDELAEAEIAVSEARGASAAVQTEMMTSIYGIRTEQRDLAIEVAALEREFMTERLQGLEAEEQALSDQLEERKAAIGILKISEEEKNALIEQAEESHQIMLKQIRDQYQMEADAQQAERDAKEAEEKALVEEALRTEKENELLAVQEQYAQLLALAEQYGYDTAELLAQQKAAEGAIEDKYRKEQDAADEADAAKRIQRRQNVVAQANSLLQAGAQFALALMESGDEQDEKTAEKRFKRGKQIQMAAAVASTASAAIAALAAPPVGLGFPAGLGGAATAAAQGAIQIATIAKQKYQPSSGGGSNTPLPTPPALNVGSGGGGGAGQGDVPDDFIIPNVDNLTEEGDVTVEPLRAYVVSQEVTDTQQAETLIENQAQL